MMNTAMQTVNVGIPSSEMKFFQELAKKMGWEIRTPERVLDAFISSRPKDVDLTDDEIMEEVREVRYNR